MLTIKNEKLLPYFKWAIYFLLLLLIYTLQTTPNLFMIFGIKPILILPLVVCVGMYEGILSSGVFAIFAGLLWDISSDKLFGFNAVILLCCSVFISLLCVYYLRTKLINAVLFCLIVALLQGLLDFVFYYALWNYQSVHLILLNRILPSIFYTVLLSPLFYYIVRSVSLKFNLTSRA